MSIAIIIQAHMSSKRLPGKVMLKYKNYNLLSLLLKRLKNGAKIKKIIIATTKNPRDVKIVNFCKKNKILFYRGSENDVLSRYYETAKKFKIKTIVRITSDCPLIDVSTLNKMVLIFKKKKLDFFSNTVPHPCKFPDGSDIEIFNFKTLRKSHKDAILPSEREHVTFFMWKTKNFRIKKLYSKKNLSKYRYTVDYIGDFKLISSMIDHFGKKIEKINMDQIINYIDNNKEKIKYQKKIFRTIGWQKSLQKDKKLI